MRLHLIHVDREVRIGHLSLQGLAHGCASGGETVEMELIFRIVQRLKERDALDLVPVIVSQKDEGLQGLAGKFPKPSLP